MGDAHRDNMRAEHEAKKHALKQTLRAVHFDRDIDLTAPTDADLEALVSQLEHDGWSWYPPVPGGGR